jgi:rare lipoprotein A
MFRAPYLAFIATGLLLVSGCHKNSSSAKHVPPPPPPAPKSAPATPPPATAATKPAPEPEVSPKTKPIYVETGLASWYGPNYHNKKGSNGEVYDQNGMTAAHRTIPLNSVVRVTNETTKHTVIVRITDRGPFIEDRIIDLSLAAAKAVDVWQPGTAMVKVEVLSSPAPIAEGGRWCVQIGAFHDEDDARKLKEKLQDRYQTAKVVQFTGPTGEWVRIRPEGDDKKKAQEVAAKTRVKEGGVFLVRMD